MARANLTISEDIISSFLGAQESPELRFLKVCIANETLILQSSVPREGSADTDFDTLIPQSLNDKEASFIIFRFGDNDSKPFSWLLLAWIPDACKVRDKMLYSSSKEDLKRSLGLGYFKGDFSANSKSDIQWSTLQQFLNRGSEKLYSATEIAVQFEKKETHVESRSTKSAAMGLLPINLSEGLNTDLQEFSAKTFNFLEISIADETMSILAKSNISSGTSFIDFINNNEVRFYLIRSCGSVNFLFSSPENASIKMKMQGASFKATVTAIIRDFGITIDKVTEVRDKNDMEDTLIDGVAVSAAATTEASTKAATITNARPSRPGRPAARPRVAKFVGDEAEEESV